ncbi:MAG: dihydrodipicolinate synthase family protein [Bacillota bacterium]
MNVEKFKGIYPAVITPFTKEGKVDEEKLRAYIAYLIKEVDGLFVCGSYGSGPIMTIAERKRVTEVTLEVVNGKVPVIVHVGCSDTASTLELAIHSEENGADAIAAVTPFYYKHLEDVIKNHYRCIVDAVKIPVLVYNNPKYSNFSVSGDLLAELAEIGVKGIKDSSADIALFYEYMAKVTRPDFLFLIGSQTHLVPSVVGGAHGCVSGLSNAFPRFIKDIYEKCVSGDFESAVALQKKANMLRTVTGSGIPIPFYHAVLPMLGIDVGYPKAPFLPLPESEVQRIKKVLVETKMVIDN